MTGAGHTVAMLSGVSQFSPTGYYSNLMRGYGYYELILKLDGNFENLKENIVQNLKKLVKCIFAKDNLKVSFTTDGKDYDKLIKPMEDFVADLPAGGLSTAKREFSPCNIKKAYTSSSQVQYVARCGNFVESGFNYTGALKVLKVIFSYDYLWNNIRVKGGAYGCMSGFSRNGDMYMVSYRDPNLKKTNEIYEV